MKRALAGIAGVIIAAGIGGWVYLSNSVTGQIYVPSGTGTTAKQTCSMVFVSGLDPDRARALYTDPLLGAAAGLLNVTVDRERRQVTASALGLAFHQTAVYREGLGCTLVHGSGEFEADIALPARPASAMTLDTAHRDTHFDTAALQAAIDNAFTEDGRNTLAVAILHEGRLIGEAYAEGVDAQTPLLGWSMTKSLAATFAGVLVQRGLMDINAQGRVPALAEAGRPEITVDHLLRMTGGLAGYEINDGTDPNSQMLFTQSDMARFAATHEQIAAPGERWDYQSGNTILAGSAMEPVMGDTLAEEAQTLRDWLFDPLGMNTAILEADEAGTLQWSSYMFASARDWARLGQLYLDDGRAPNGTQIIPADWIDYIRRPTPGSDGNYGAGFWMYETGLPDGTFIMNGFQGQLAFIIPSEDLVIVRMGATNFQNDGAIRFANDVVAARLGEPLAPPALEEAVQ